MPGSKFNGFGCLLAEDFQFLKAFILLLSGWVFYSGIFCVYGNPHFIECGLKAGKPRFIVNRRFYTTFRTISEYLLDINDNLILLTDRILETVAYRDLTSKNKKARNPSLLQSSILH